MKDARLLKVLVERKAGQVTEDHRRGKGIFYERLIDQVGSVWIWT